MAVLGTHGPVMEAPALSLHLTRWTREHVSAWLQAGWTSHVGTGRAEHQAMTCDAQVCSALLV